MVDETRPVEVQIHCTDEAMAERMESYRFTLEQAFSGNELALRRMEDLLAEDVEVCAAVLVAWVDSIGELRLKRRLSAEKYALLTAQVEDARRMQAGTDGTGRTRGG